MGIAKDGYDRVEHDGDVNAKNMSLVKSTATIYAVVNTSAGGGNVTVEQGTDPWVTDASGATIFAVVNTSAGGGNVTVEQGTTPWATSFSGNITLDEGSLTGIRGNVTLSDPKGFIGLVTVVGSLSPAAGNVTLDSGSLTGIVGNVTLSDSKTYIGLTTTTVANTVTVDATGQGDVPITLDGEVVSTSFSGNVTIDSGVITSITNPVATKGNVTIDSGNISILGNVTIHDPNLIDSNNSTTSTLAGDATYTGTGTDVSQYSSISIQLDSSHDSATDGMTFQFSTDDSNWDDVYPFTYTAADGSRRFQFPVTAQYFRVVYTNGSVGQTHFRVQTILHTSDIITSVHRLVDDEKIDRSATLHKSAIIAQVNGSGDFTPIQANAAGVLKVGGSVDVDSIAGNVTIDSGTITSVTDITNPIAIKGNVTIDSGTVSIDSNTAWADPNTYIGLATIDIGSAPTLTVDATGQGDVPVTLGGEVVSTTFSGNVTLDSGSLTGIVGNVTVDQVDTVTTVTAVTDITNPVALKGNLTLSDSKTFIGLTTVVQASTDRSIIGNITLSDPKGFIGLVTIVGSLAPASGNVTLDPGSQTGIVGNVTLSDPKGFIGLVTVVGSLSPAAGNVTLDAGSLTGIVGNVTLSDPKGFIGLVTVVGSLSPAAGNVTLDAGSLTGIIGNVTVEQGDNPWVTSNVGNITVEQGDNPWVVDLGANNDVTLTGNVTIDSGTITAVTDITNPVAATQSGDWSLTGNVTLSDPKTYIGLVTVSIGDENTVAAAFAGNVTLDAGSLTGIVGNVTVDQVDTVTTVTAVTDITNPIALKGNITIDSGTVTLGSNDGVDIGNVDVASNTAWADPNTYIGLVTVDIGASNTVDASFSGNVTLDAGSLTGIVGNVTIEDGGVALTVDGSGVTQPVSFAGNVTLDAGSLTGIVGNITVDQVDTVTTVTAVTDITNPVAATQSGAWTLTGNVTIEDGGESITVDGTVAATQSGDWSLTGNVTVDQVDVVTAVTDITNPIALKGNITLEDPKTYIGLVTTTYAPVSLATAIQTVISATGQTAISSAVASNYFYVQDIFVSSLGRAEVRFEEGSTVMIPYASLATTSGYAMHFGEGGLRAGTVNTAFNARLNGAATVSVMANIRWHTT